MKTMKNYKTIEIMTYITFITGFLLWEDLGIQWQTFKISQILHFLVSIVITVFLLLPFMFSHVKKHKKTILKSKKSYKKRRQTFLGILMGITLLSLIISGIYLFFVGNRGGDTYGIVSNFVHFYFSFLFAFLIIYHSYYLGRDGVRKDKDFLKKLFNKKSENQ